VKKKEVVKILEENKLTNITPMDFKEAVDKEQKELDESMKESFRQRDERKKKEKLAYQRTSGSVSFIEEGEFIMCSKCLDNTPHKPAWGICQRCGTQYTTSLKVKTESEKMQEELEPLPYCPMSNE